MTEPSIIYLLEWWRTPGTRGFGGGTAYNYELVTALARRWPVTVIALFAPSGEAPAGARLSRFNESASRLPKSRWRYWRQDLRRALANKPTPRLLLTTSATNAVVSEMVDTGVQVCSVIQAYEDFGWRAPGHGDASRVRSLKRLLGTGQWLKPAFTRAGSLLANSEYMVRATQRAFRGAPPGFVLYPPQMLTPCASRMLTSEASNCVGFYNRAGKNVSFVLDLAAATLEKEFHIFGYPLATQRHLPANVAFHGWQLDIARMYKQADIWIVPSEWQEPFGMVAIEALSQGCRVAVANRGGLPEAVGSCARIFDRFDVEEWRDWVLNGQPPSDEERLEHVERFSLANFRARATEWCAGLLE